MHDPNNTTGTLDQTDEDILTYTVSDEEIEQAEVLQQQTWWFTLKCRPCPPGQFPI
jgi:hypothetical protein